MEIRPLYPTVLSPDGKDRFGVGDGNMDLSRLADPGTNPAATSPSHRSFIYRESGWEWAGSTRLVAGPTQKKRPMGQSGRPHTKIGPIEPALSDPLGQQGRPTFENWNPLVQLD